MANPALAGFVYDSAGAAVSGVAINVYAAGDTATALSSTTTAADGSWSIANSSVQNPDIEMVNGTEITRFKYGDRVAFSQMDAQVFVLRNDTATSSFATNFVPATLSASHTITVPDQTGTIVTSSGSTNELIFDVTNLTANRVITVPDDSGQLVIGSGSSNVVRFDQSGLTADRLIAPPDDSGTLALIDYFQTASRMVIGTGVELRKTSSQTISTTTLENDTHLQITLSSATTYKIDLLVYYTMGSSGDLTAKWSVSSGATLLGMWNANGQEGAVTAASSFDLNAGVGTPVAALFTGQLTTGASAGVTLPQWRQSSAESTASVIEAGMMRVTRISS